MYWVIGGIILAGILYALDREIYFYEATHLGPRIQSWLYDRWARKYDQGKAESQKHDAVMLAKPALDVLEGIPQPFVLDFATGTGRLPLALLSAEQFHGHVIAADVSRGMLEEAAIKIARHHDKFTLLRIMELPLPFPDNAFDLVSCMEALEIMPEMETPLSELFRVLRPGGMLLTSRATEESGRRARVKSSNEFKQLLKSAGFEQIEITKWWKIFDRVTARKPGQLTASGNHALTDALLCPKCRHTPLENRGNELQCSQCGAGYQILESGIVLL